MWAGRPKKAIKIEPEDGMDTDKMCDSVRTQLLKMLSVGVIVCPGFSPPVGPEVSAERCYTRQ